MFGLRMRDILDAIPTTGRDGGNVVALRDPDAPPGGLTTVWREMREQVREIHDMRAKSGTPER